MIKILKDILTGADNESYDHGRVLGLMTFVMYFGLAVTALVINHSFDPMNFAGGASTMAVGFGIHLKLKSDTEPPCK
jgi:hypothetical protein